MTKIVIADDHRVVRSGLRMLLDREDGFEVVAEAGDVADARRYVRAHRPDVLVLDLNMPGEPTLPALDGLAQVSPDTRVVVLTMFNEPVFAREALRAGAAAFVLKHAADAEQDEDDAGGDGALAYQSADGDLLSRLSGEHPL